MKCIIAHTFQLPDTVAVKVRQEINQHYFGDTTVNEDVNGKLVGKFDSHPSFTEVQNLHWITNMYMTVLYEYEVGIDAIPRFVRVVPENEIKHAQAQQQ